MEIGGILRPRFCWNIKPIKFKHKYKHKFGHFINPYIFFYLKFYVFLKHP